MRRSTAKKIQKPAPRDQQTDQVDDSEWFNVMRATLSPYWSARLEHTNDRTATSNPTHEEAA